MGCCRSAAAKPRRQRASVCAPATGCGCQPTQVDSRALAGTIIHMPAVRRIPEATVARLPLYLRALHEAARDRTVTISSEALAGRAGVNAPQVRKDLSHLGSYGTRGVGYD